MNPTNVQASAHTLYGPVLDVGFWLPPGAMSLLEQWSILFYETVRSKYTVASAD